MWHIPYCPITRSNRYALRSIYHEISGLSKTLQPSFGIFQISPLLRSLSTTGNQIGWHGCPWRIVWIMVGRMRRCFSSPAASLIWSDLRSGGNFVLIFCRTFMTWYAGEGVWFWGSYGPGFNSLRTERGFLRKVVELKNLMVPSESAPQELPMNGHVSRFQQS
jgi:hypothetical protein